MFVDEITIYAKAGDGGDGVARWRHEKFKPKAGPAGGNGGNGGDIIMRAVKDVNRLAKYVGIKKFTAENGQSGMSLNKHGKNGQDLVIEIPLGSVVTDVKRNRVYEFNVVGHEEKIFKGGRGGFGNEHFKSSTNRAPLEYTIGNKGEEGDIKVELSLVVDVGLVGMPNAGKSTLLNVLTNAESKIGDYPFTTLKPQLGDLNGFVIADIPGLIEGASDGKGLGHSFLRHVSRTKMILHLISLEENDILNHYNLIKKELENFDKSLTNKEEWIVLTKNDLVNKEYSGNIEKFVDKFEKRVFVISVKTGSGVKELKDALIKHLDSSK